MTDKEKPTTAWYLAPIFLVVIGSAIMWYVLKDNEHEITKSMIHKGWVIGIVLTIIPFLMWIPFMVMLPMMGEMISEQGMMGSMMKQGMMGSMMEDPAFRQQMMEQGMIGSMMEDPAFRQQMMEQMLQNQEFMQELMQNSQFMQQMNP